MRVVKAAKIYFRIYGALGIIGLIRDLRHWLF